MLDRAMQNQNLVVEFIVLVVDSEVRLWSVGSNSDQID